MTEPANSQRSCEHATFTIDRVYDASPQQVFAAWADPAAKESWFGPPASVGSERSLDFEVGGREHFLAGGSDGSQYTYDARYAEIVPDRTDSGRSIAATAVGSSP